MKIDIVKNGTFGKISKAGYKHFIFLALCTGNDGLAISLFWWAIVVKYQ